MSIKDFGFWFRDFWSDFKKEKSGLVGLGIIAVSILIVILEPFCLTWDATNSKWRDISYWQDNSPSAPPAWTNAFSSKKAAVTSKLMGGKREESELDGGVRLVTTSYDYNFTADEAPLDLIFHCQGTGDNVNVKFDVTRPDGETIELAQRLEQGIQNADIRLSAENDGRDAAFGFLKAHESEANLASLSSESLRSTEIIFNTAREGMSSQFKALKGHYTVTATSMLINPDTDKIEKPYVVVTGSVSGVLGTDNMKRDIFSGLVAGLKWALFIGLFTSIVSVLIGVMYGIISAYYGGKVDSVMQFIFQIFNSMPVMPILIVLSAIFKPNIWFLIAVMVLFFWTGSVMTVRSMAMQIKEETYIEAAKALGASNSRIIWKHMTPLLIPYSFASMALAVPAAIVYESSISLLGLGDATIVTWGQILHDAMQGSAILNHIWWWIIPPGLLIAIMGMAFAFLGFAMDKILNPKLRTR
jgi:peptide/nickel transport system permease protein